MDRMDANPLLARLLGRAAESSPDRVAVATGRSELTWSQLLALSHRYRDELQHLAGARIGFQYAAAPASVAALAALETLRCATFLVDSELSLDDARRVTAEFSLSRFVRIDPSTVPGDQIGSRLQVHPGHAAHPALPEAAFKETDSSSLDSPQPPRIQAGSPAPVSLDPPEPAEVVILTSGTTGKPKAARHCWQSLARPVRTSSRTSPAAPQTWLQSYRPHLYAGLQVLLQALSTGGTLVMDDRLGDLPALLRQMAERRVEFASATPSYWRRLVMLAPAGTLDRIPLRQITLGGEIADQGLLDGLRAAFPQARIAHIYATTELGRCFSVTDGQSGFPAAYLDAPSPDGVELAVRGQELWVRPANGMVGYDERSSGRLEADGQGWIATGDLVERRGERMHFIGRRSEIINAGGNKVAPAVVEAAIRSVSGVTEVRVMARRSSLTGQLVACEVAIAPGVDAGELKRRVHEHCRQRLAPHERPRLITVVDRLELTDAGKLARRAG